MRGLIDVGTVRIVALLVVLGIVNLTSCGNGPTEPRYQGWQSLGLEDRWFITLALDEPYLYVGSPSGVSGLFKADISAGRPEWEDLRIQSVFKVQVLETGRLLVASTTGLLRSDDGGHTWSRSDSGMACCSGSFMVVSMAECGGTVYAGTNWRGLYKSTDYGVSWTLVSGDDSLLYYDIVCSPQMMVARGSTLHGQVVRVSGDHGRTWQEVPSSALLDESPESIAVDPNDGGVAYIGVSGGVVKTADGGESWFPILQPQMYSRFSALAHDPEVAGHIFMAGNVPLGNTSRWVEVLYRSADGGDSVEALDTAAVREITDMEFDSKNGVLFMASLKGVYGYYMQ